MGMMMNYGMRLELLVCHFEIDQTILWYIKLTKLSRDQVFLGFQYRLNAVCTKSQLDIEQIGFPIFFTHLYNFALLYKNKTVASLMNRHGFNKGQGWRRCNVQDQNNGLLHVSNSQRFKGTTWSCGLKDLVEFDILLDNLKLLMIAFKNPRSDLNIS